jgi:hypothetical protein
MNLYAIDFDMDGTIDPLITAFWEDNSGKLREYPVNYLDELWAQSSFFAVKFSNYKSFSYSDISTIFDENTLKRLKFQFENQHPEKLHIVERQWQYLSLKSCRQHCRNRL